MTDVQQFVNETRMHECLIVVNGSCLPPMLFRASDLLGTGRALTRTMSKSGGGGGLKGHDKGGGGSKVKMMKSQASLESALDKVPDVIVCPKEHRMKLHTGSKREGPLTCDGPEDLCCGRDGEGVLEVGDARYSCVECDFDICESCVDAETKEPLTAEQERRATRTLSLTVDAALTRP